MKRLFCIAICFLTTAAAAQTFARPPRSDDRNDVQVEWSRHDGFVVALGLDECQIHKIERLHALGYPQEQFLRELRRILSRKQWKRWENEQHGSGHGNRWDNRRHDERGDRNGGHRHDNDRRDGGERDKDRHNDDRRGRR